MNEPCELAEGLRFDLHELCQPLTTLRCRLELAEMESSARGGRDDPETLDAVVVGALEDMGRVFEVVSRMRQRLMEEAGG